MTSFYDKVEAIPGWLNKVTAFRTMDMLQWQVDQGITGHLLEIGVYCGKYFAVLLQSALAANGKVLGIDTFQYTDQARVQTEMTKALGAESLAAVTLWKRSSTAVTAAEIEAAIGRPRFISLDGAHDYESVYRDLILCEQVLHADGIIAADDFLNPLTLGVNAAVNMFLSMPRNVVPVAYIANKLFLAHRSREDDYRAAIERAIMAADDPQSANFRKMLKQGRHHIEQDLYGHKVLLS